MSVDSEEHYLYLGMAELATFNVSGSFTEAGIRVGDQTFRGWPMPGGKPGFFSLFAFAWNMPPSAADRLRRQRRGHRCNQSSRRPVPQEGAAQIHVHELQISDQFLQKVVGESDPNGTGDPVARFVKINNEMRKANNKTLSDLRLKTADKFLWSQPFPRQSHSQAEATFADLRNYIYQGKKIDQQVHLGYDLAATQHVGVQASNDGRVVYAAPLGIYGNCIVVDHGYGLQTIYGHLSQIQVKEGDMVKQGQVMGPAVKLAWPVATTSISPCKWMASRSIRKSGGILMDQGPHRQARGPARLQLLRARAPVKASHARHSRH